MSRITSKPQVAAIPGGALKRYRRLWLSLLPLVILILLSGCNALDRTRPDPFYSGSPLYPQQSLPADGAIYHANASIRLFEDTRARQTGDIITVILMENTDASKSATTATNRESEIDLPAAAVITPFTGGAVGALGDLSASVNTGQDFSGSGTSAQSNRLKGSITVVVTEVLPNGNLVIRGEKILALNQGDEYVRLIGVVRPLDIAQDNTVPSTRIANARISYGGKGALVDANSHGWLSRFFLKAWPF